MKSERPCANVASSRRSPDVASLTAAGWVFSAMSLSNALRGCTASSAFASAMSAQLSCTKPSHPLPAASSASAIYNPIFFRWLLVLSVRSACHERNLYGAQTLHTGQDRAEVVARAGKERL